MVEARISTERHSLRTQNKNYFIISFKKNYFVVCFMLIFFGENKNVSLTRKGYPHSGDSIDLSDWKRKKNAYMIVLNLHRWRIFAG